MPDTQENATDQVAAAQGHNYPPKHICIGCGDPMHRPEKSRGTLPKLYCDDKCRRGYHNRNKAEGGPMVPYVKAWHQTRHAKPGTREAEICKFARGQLTQMARHWIDRDQAEGRDTAVEYVGTLMDNTDATMWIDRVRG